MSATRDLIPESSSSSQPLPIRNFFKKSINLTILSEIYYDAYEKRIALLGLSPALLKTALSAYLDIQFQKKHAKIRELILINIPASAGMQSIKEVFLSSIMAMEDSAVEEILFDKILKATQDKCLVSFLAQLQTMRERAISFINDIELSLSQPEQIAFSRLWRIQLERAEVRVSYHEKIGSSLSEHYVQKHTKWMCGFLFISIINYYNDIVTDVVVNIGSRILPPPTPQTLRSIHAYQEDSIWGTGVYIGLFVLAATIFMLKKSYIDFTPAHCDLQQLIIDSCKEYTKKYPEITFILQKSDLPSKNDVVTQLFDEEEIEIKSKPKRKVQTDSEEKKEEKKKENKEVVPRIFESNPNDFYAEILNPSQLKSVKGKLFLHVNMNDPRHQRIYQGSENNVLNLARDRRTSTLFPPGHQGAGFNIIKKGEKDLSHCHFKAKFSNGTRIGFGVRPPVPGEIDVLEEVVTIASPRGKAGK